MLVKVKEVRIAEFFKGDAADRARWAIQSSAHKSIQSLLSRKFMSS